MFSASGRVNWSDDVKKSHTRIFPNTAVHIELFDKLEFGELLDI